MSGYLKGNTYNPETIPTVFDQLSFWSSRFGALLFENIELRPNLNILDLGCATGFPLFELAFTFGASCRVTGIDVWAEALERARQKQAIYNLPNVEIIEADGARMPFEDAEFDLVVSNLGINNFEYPKLVAAECFRILKPGGSVALTTNLTGHMREFYAVFRQLLTEHGNSEYLHRLDANEAHRGTGESVSNLLQQAGFGIERVVESSFLMRYLDGSALLNHSLTRLGFLDAWRAVVNPEDEVELFTRLEEQLNNIAAEQGELIMTVPMLYIGAKKHGSLSAKTYAADRQALSPAILSEVGERITPEET
jgi:ubiquinone/menaquinone biosynthesis C-methylase UbiE